MVHNGVRPPFRGRAARSEENLSSWGMGLARPSIVYRSVTLYRGLVVGRLPVTVGKAEKGDAARAESRGQGPVVRDKGLA